MPKRRLSSEPSESREANHASGGNSRLVSGGASVFPWKSFWLGCYSFILAGMIVAYYAILLVLLFEGVQQGWKLFQGESLWPGAVGGVLLFLLAGAMGWRLIRDLPGLVTPIYDEAPEAEAGIAVTTENYPELFEIVSSVANRIGSAMPDDIRITFLAQCYVTERRRFSISTKRRLTLVLGLPQLKVLSISELKVILAHELAHFRSGDTTLVVFIFRFVETLRAAVAESEGSWRRWCNPIHWICAAYFRLFLYLSGPLLRRQELAADRLSAGIFGAELARHTLLKDWLLVGQFDTAVAHFASLPHGKDTEESVFQFFAQRWHNFSADGEAYLLRRLAEEEKGSFFDPRPTMKDRIEAMAEFPSQEEPRDEPAQILLGNSSSLEAKLEEMMFTAEE